MRTSGFGCRSQEERASIHREERFDSTYKAGVVYIDRFHKPYLFNAFIPGNYNGMTVWLRGMLLASQDVGRPHKHDIRNADFS